MPRAGGSQWAPRLQLGADTWKVRVRVRARRAWPLTRHGSFRTARLTAGRRTQPSARSSGRIPAFSRSHRNDGIGGVLRWPVASQTSSLLACSATSGSHGSRTRGSPGPDVEVVHRGRLGGRALLTHRHGVGTHKCSPEVHITTGGRIILIPVVVSTRARPSVPALRRRRRKPGGPGGPGCRQRIAITTSCRASPSLPSLHGVSASLLSLLDSANAWSDAAHGGGAARRTARHFFMNDVQGPLRWRVEHLDLPVDTRARRAISATACRWAGDRCRRSARAAISCTRL